jgi:ABC-type antimicrobial peptide transport system permease subunit
MQFGTLEEGFDYGGVVFDSVLWPRIVIADAVSSSIVVFVMTTLAGLIPAIRAARLSPTEALREE